MGAAIITDGAITPTLKVIANVDRGLEGWFEFDTSVSNFNLNRAPNKPNAVIIGSPSAYSSHGRFKGLTNFIQTPIGDSDEVTIIVVARTVLTPTGNADGSILVGGYTGTSVTSGITGSAAGANIYLANPTSATGSASRNDGAGVATAAGVSGNGIIPTSWAIRSVRAKTGSPTILTDHTAGLSFTGTSILQRALNGNKYRIGSGTSSFIGECDISMAAIFSAYHSDAELQANLDMIRLRLTRIGINA
ncbi:hypothetical protein [Pseudomonas sp. NPDC087626]|jgi:hypothetical protein|uniref:hypothetical protein n=1 Tax=Pseudomonas sp. NPDC087626 TaxID=3364444 RepID=UPI00380605AD